MEQREKIYVRVESAGELKKLLEDTNCELDLQKSFETRDLEKVMKSLGFNNSPEDQIRETAPKAIGTFVLKNITAHETISNILKNYGVPDSEIQKSVEGIPNIPCYHLFPDDGQSGKGQTIFGEIDLYNSDNIVAFLIGYDQPYAKVTDGGGILENETELHYDKSIFPSKTGYQMGNKLVEGKFVKL